MLQLSSLSTYFGGEHSREVDLCDHLLVHEGRSSRVLHVMLFEQMPHPGSILSLGEGPATHCMARDQ